MSALPSPPTCPSALPPSEPASTGALSWPNRLDGRPEQFEIGGDSAYYIWTDGENEFHLATTGPGPRREFVAVVRTNGEITDVDQVRLEDDDSFELEDGGQKLVIRFATCIFGSNGALFSRLATNSRPTSSPCPRTSPTIG